MTEIRDEYHTMDELYDHRNKLFLALTRKSQGSWWSLLHDDGTHYDGWFIAGMPTKNGMITYHIPIKFVHLAGGERLRKAPKWDGHTPEDVLERLDTINEDQIDQDALGRYCER